MGSSRHSEKSTKRSSRRSSSSSSHDTLPKKGKQDGGADRGLKSKTSSTPPPPPPVSTPPPPSSKSSKCCKRCSSSCSGDCCSQCCHKTLKCAATLKVVSRFRPEAKCTTSSKATGGFDVGVVVTPSWKCHVEELCTEKLDCGDQLIMLKARVTSSITAKPVLKAPVPIKNQFLNLGVRTAVRSETSLVSCS